MSSESTSDNSSDASKPGNPFQRPEYISNGRCCVEDALREAGIGLYGAEWTGDEMLIGSEESWDNYIVEHAQHLRSNGEVEYWHEALDAARQHRRAIQKRREGAQDRLRRLLDDGHVRSYGVTHWGDEWPIKPSLWRGRHGFQALRAGYIPPPSEDIKNPGYVLIDHEDLSGALREQANATEAEAVNTETAKTPATFEHGKKRIGRPPTAPWVHVLMMAAWWYEWHKPEKKAELERFIHAELDARGTEASESTVRGHATKLIDTYQNWIKRDEK